tara:strand:- start:311 stop:520 length:210 start_codon:yes stop_codon:yes gene_type:complete
MAKETNELTLAKPEEAPKPTLKSTNERIDKLIEVLNNLIAYCNTIERWRTQTFKQQEAAPEEPEPPAPK